MVAKLSIALRLATVRGLDSCANRAHRKIGLVMNAENRARALRMLKALARAIIEELDYDGKPIDPHTVAERALHGYPHTPEHDRDAIGREIEDYVRDILARRGGT